MKDHLPILPILLPWAAAPLALLAGTFSSLFARVLGLGALGLGLVSAGEILRKVSGEAVWPYSLGGWPPPWGIELSITPFQALFACLLLALAFLTLLLSGGAKAYGTVGRWNIRFFPAGILFLTGNLLALLFTRDLFTHYLLLQATVLGVGFLLGLACVPGPGAAFQWTLIGSTGASLFLWGVLQLWSSAGSLHYGDLQAQLYILGRGEPGALAGIFLTVGWGTLMAFPQRFPYGELALQLPPFLTAFLSSALVRLGALSLFFHYFFVLNVPGAARPAWLEPVGGLAVVLLLASFAWALRRSDFQGALSSLGLSQLGFLFAGFLLGNKPGLSGALMELLAQTLTLAGLYFAAGTLKANAGAQPLFRLSGLALRRPWTGLALILLTASAAGVPPTAGFFGKYYLVLGALEKGDAVLLSAVGAACLLQLGVFLRFLLLLFEHRSPAAPPEPPSRTARLPALLLAAGVLVLGLFHEAVMARIIEPALPKAFLEIPSPYVPFLGKEVE